MVGTKWYKCDLHLHTPASKCFRDRSITPEQWVQEAIQKGLDCVAVTDHNTGEWVDDLKAAAHGTSLVVFPGVELTCSDAKVHLLIVFDTQATKQTVEDFITLSHINRSQFGEQDAHSPMSVEEILDLATSQSALCIPAHIDEFNGLSEVANTPRQKILKDDRLLGVQVVHPGILISESKYNSTEKEILTNSINKYFGATDKEIIERKFKITEERIKDWRQTVMQAVKCEKAILTFSDNPHAPRDSKHGLAGIGSRYTWIKMEQKPSLESLRQALLLHRFRIRPDFDCLNHQKPYNNPLIWIQKIKICATEISHASAPLELEFSPQMNSIIGGRGSGKSSILQFIRGVFKRGDELSSLDSVHDEFKRFFQLTDRAKRGVLKAGCTIEITIQRRDEIFSVRMAQGTNPVPTIELYKLNEVSGQFELHDPTFMTFLEFDIFSQKQIYEIATNLNSLRERIDESTDIIKNLKTELEIKASEYIEKASIIRTMKVKVERKPLLLAEIADTQNKINKFNEIGIQQELQDTQAFQTELNQLKAFVDQIKSREIEFENLAESVLLPQLNIDHASDMNRETLRPHFETINKLVQEVASNILKIKSKYSEIPRALRNEIGATSWNSGRKLSIKKFNEKKSQLIEAGVETIDQIEEDIKVLERKKQDLLLLEETEKEILLKEAEKALLKSEFVAKRLELTEARKTFLSDLLKDGNVRAKVQYGKDYSNLEEKLRNAIGCQNAFDDDINKLVETWKSGSPQTHNQATFDLILSMHNGTYTSGAFFQRFVSKIQTLNGEQLDKVDLIFPEDEIQLEYKTQAGQWKLLSNVSAGQKTAAILTLILSQGDKPLILDQPEDDLDNFLIYDLVVDKLRKSKESRQIITVTHNANIPVNGDSEYIIVMDSDSKYIQTKELGCIEDTGIKNAICTIMEGGKEAFDMRSKRYRHVQ
ncbi:TrlF family AAA-like ATPase [Pedobacter sp. P351]|uniref:TrlF family AAA-like ATPase n=1 Tax=Pedobacter superstes TaxID=3133441 RepID=UPI0030A68D2A